MVRCVAGYLDGRKTRVQHGREVSNVRDDRGGSAQGAKLSSTLFVAVVDGLLKNLEKEMEPLERNLLCPSQFLMFADDLCVRISYPRNSFTSGNFEDDGRLKKVLKIVESFSAFTQMKLNRAKTRALVFDRATTRKINFPDECLKFESGEVIEIVKSTKMLGIHLADNHAFDVYTEEKVRSGQRAVWCLRRMLANGCPPRHLKAFYKGAVRSVIEYGLDLLIHSLNQSQIKQIEDLQRQASAILLNKSRNHRGPEYLKYAQRLTALDLETIESRAKRGFARTARKLEFREDFRGYFRHRQCERRNTGHGMRRTLPPYEEPTDPGATERMKKSPVCQMTVSLNQCRTPFGDRQRAHINS